MQCGHTANATMGNQPCCAICITAGTSSKALEAVTRMMTKPSLEGRKARCSYGMQNGQCLRNRKFTEIDSTYDLAFFKYKPEADYDEYYCGCFGWD